MNNSRFIPRLLLASTFVLLFLGLSWKTGLFERSITLKYPRCEVITTRLTMSLHDRSMQTTIDDVAFVETLIEQPIREGVRSFEVIDPSKLLFSIVVKKTSRESKRFRVNAEWSLIYDEDSGVSSTVNLQQLREYVEKQNSNR